MAWWYGSRRAAPFHPRTCRDEIIEPMNRRSISLSVAVMALTILVGVALLVPVPYVVMSPGLTENTIGKFDGKEVIGIEGAKTYPTSGRLDLTTVSVTSPGSDVRLPDVLGAWWSAERILLPREVVYPPDQSVQQVEEENQTQMLGSMDSARAVGLAQAGVDAVKVKVEGVTPDAPADGVLQEGDEIVAVNSTAIGSTQAAVDAISTIAPGSRIALEIVRSGSSQEVRVTTAPSPEDAAQSRVGVILSDDFDPPFEVDIELGQEIGGPSAGLMFSLGIYDKLTPGELTGGAHIAGTGTIDVGGRVGEIGGIQQKIAGAREIGATIFLVPAGDCADVGGFADDEEIRLVKVATMDDAVEALESLRAGDESSVEGCDSQ